MDVAIIGSGLQAMRRGIAVVESTGDSLVSIYSDNKDTGISLSKRLSTNFCTDIGAILDNENIEIVIICTPPSSHSDLALRSLAAGKHVLLEKPFTKTNEESKSLLEFTQKHPTILRCGFNHRFHPAILELKKLTESGHIGDLKFARGIYGIGMRDGYLDEWRANTSISAGGQFMEQGSHLVDLMQYILGPVSTIYAKNSNFMLPQSAGEDTGMALLTHQSGAVSNVLSSLLIWHNRFSLEFYGEKGFICVEGLGGSYGVETLRIGMNSPGMPFRNDEIQFRGGDVSWRKEWESFKDAIKGLESCCATPNEADHVMNVVTSGYQSALNGHEIRILD
jgi:predicted dehydrogenase